MPCADPRIEVETNLLRLIMQNVEIFMDKRLETKPVRRTPKNAVRAYCLHCTGGNRMEVKSCTANDPDYQACPLHPYRMGKGRVSVRVLRKFCLQCMGGSKAFVRECETTDCLIHPYRSGKNPSRAGMGQSDLRMASVRQKTRCELEKPGLF